MASHAKRLRPRERTIFKLSLTTVISAGVVFLGATTALAEPSAVDLERQIDQAWNALEPVIEQHNATRLELAKQRVRSEELAKQIQPLEAQVDVATSRVGDMAVLAYKGASTSALNALLTSGSPTALADQLTVLDQVARVQQQQIDVAADLMGRYEVQKAAQDQLVARLAKTEADLAAKASQINAEIKRLEVLQQHASARARTRTTGSGSGSSSPRPAGCPASNPGGKAGIAVNFACAQIGKPYRWGAEGPGAYDCSGLTMAAWARAGVDLPHNAAAQRRAVPSVSRANLRPGDLVFYYSDLHHVAMYVGGGWIVHASRAGVPVRMREMDTGNIHSYGRPG